MDKNDAQGSNLSRIWNRFTDLDRSPVLRFIDRILDTRLYISQLKYKDSRSSYFFKNDGSPSEDGEVRINAALKLGEIGRNSVIIAALTGALKTEKELTVIPWINKSLIKIGKPAVPALIDLLAAKEWAARENASEILGEIGDDRAVPALIGALKDELRGVRMKAAEALGKIGDERALPPLMDLLDEDKYVLEWAARALVNIFGEVSKKEDHRVALKMIKNLTIHIRKIPDKHARRELIGNLSEVTQQVHDRMTDKKKFPIKHQPVRMLERKRLANRL